MDKQVNFSRIKKCDQIWDEMPESEKGKLCMSCRQIIYDFRGKSKWEIAVVHAHSESRVCGIYDNKTLSNPKQNTTTSLSRRNVILASTIGLLSANVASSNPKEHHKKLPESTFQFEFIDNALLDRSCDNHEIQKKQNQDSLKLVRGIVKDDSGEPLVGCNIVMLSTSDGTITDVDGRFSLGLTNAISGMESIVLDISYVGFGKNRKTILLKDLEDKDEVYLDLVLKQDLEMEVFSVSPKRKFHQRVWQKIKSMF